MGYRHSAMGLATPLDKFTRQARKFGETCCHSLPVDNLQLNRGQVAWSGVVRRLTIVGSSFV